MTVVFALVVASVVGFAALHTRPEPEPEPGPSRFGPARLTCRGRDCRREAMEAEARRFAAGPCVVCELERQVRIDAGYRRLAEDVLRPGDET